MSNFTPNFSNINKIEEDLLTSKLTSVRLAISHPGEKGRTLELEVLKLLRDLLPSEYGLSSGFIVYHTNEGPKLSKQLDVIIYDAIRCGPIVRLLSCDVFPLEAVYGYVEVKAALKSSTDNADKSASNSIETCLAENKILRGMIDRKFTYPATKISSGLVSHEWMRIRSYVFAFSIEGSIAGFPAKFAQRIANVSKKLGPPTHLHGIFIANYYYFATKAVDLDEQDHSELYHIQYTEEHTLMAFKTSLLRSLACFPRFDAAWTPAIHLYYDNPSWFEVAPE